MSSREGNCTTAYCLCRRTPKMGPPPKVQWRLMPSRRSTNSFFLVLMASTPTPVYTSAWNTVSTGREKKDRRVDTTMHSLKRPSSVGPYLSVKAMGPTSNCATCCGNQTLCHWSRKLMRRQALSVHGLKLCIPVKKMLCVVHTTE